MTWVKITAAGPLLTSEFKLSSDRAHFGELVSPASADEATQKLRASSLSATCRDPSASAFIAAGGKYQFSYDFNDGEHFMDVLIDHCN